MDLMPPPGGPGSKSGPVTSRRTKKRPSYGMRTVELIRGQSGFGFTLSGQGPCILSNIVSESPASRAGLRSGDHVIAVNGRNVSKSGHDEVVKMIGNSTGVLKLQIAESYCSNSSSEEEQVNRKYERTAQAIVHHHHHHPAQAVAQQPASHSLRGYVSDDEEYTLSPGVVLPPPPLPRPFHMRGNSADSTLTESSVLQSYERPKRPSPRKRAVKSKPHESRGLTPSKSASNLKRVELHGGEELQLSEHQIQAFIQPTLEEFRRSIKQQNTAKHQEEVESAILKAVVGYLGTIEIPSKEGATGLTAIRNCIRRLRIEKKVHTLVLMCVQADKIVLINHHGSKLAEYPSDRVTFCGMYLDDKRFFGLVTSQLPPDDDDESVDGAGSIGLSSSCHVFMTEPVDEDEMQRRAKAFRFQLTPALYRIGEYVEFPLDARHIIRTITSVYGKVEPESPPVNVAESSAASTNSEARSPTSSSTNSDSGIGYRDDGDPVLLLDPQSPPPDLHQAQAIGKPVLEANEEILENVANEEKERFDVRAMPPPKDLLSPDPGELFGGGSADESFNTEQLDSQHSAANLRQSMQKYLQSKHEHLKKASQQLLENRPSQIGQGLMHPGHPLLGIKPRLVTPTSSSASSSRDPNLTGKAATGKPVNPSNLLRTPSERSGSVRSLEDIRFDRAEFSPPSSLQTSDLFAARFPSSVSSSLLDKFLYSSETNLSQLTDGPLLSLMPGRGILKPCDQYPSEPGVLNSRPVSVQSGYGIGGSTTSAPSRNGDDFQEEFEEDEIVFGQKGSESRGWSRGSSLRKHLRRRSFSSSRIDQVGQQEKTNTIQKASYGDDVTITDEVDPETSSQAGSLASERGIDIGRVGSWAMDFEKLLADQIGLRTFAEFLKKEFSHENIYFWTACERYRRLGPDCPYEKRRKVAGDIIRRHLASGAPEPVNVDSHARQAAIDGLESAAPGLFATAQKQIYNLMKFDSFSRFLKSDLYNESLTSEMSGKQLRFDPAVTDADPDLEIGSAPDKSSLGRKNKVERREPEIAQSNPGSEPSRRRSLLPSWNNLRGGSGSKDRSKSKDRGELSIKKPKDDPKRLLPDPESQSSSHNTSNESEDGGCKLARVILPDKATTVVQTRQGETIRAMVARLLEKRALKFTSFDVFTTENAEKPLDLSDDSTTLGCTEVRVEPRVLFRLELPSKKSIGVKAKPAKLVKDVLGPILSQYGWNLDMMSVRREGDPQQHQPPVDLFNTVASIDNCRLVVHPRSTAEINSRVLEDLLRVKSTVERLNNVDDDDRHSVKSENSSGSARHRVLPRSSTTTNLKQLKQSADLDEKHTMPPPGMIPHRRLPQPPTKNPIVRPFPGYNNPISEDLYEGLKIVQRGRLEDQRGTEINFEMPDFLKRGTNKENFGPPPYHPVGHSGPPTRQSEPVIRRDVFPSVPHDRHSTQGPSHHQPYDHSLGRPSHDFSRHNESTFSNEGFLPSLQEADRFFGNGYTTPQDDFSMMSSDSRLSFGMRINPAPHPTTAGSHFQDPIYETLSSYNKHDHQSRRWSSNISTVSAPNLTGGIVPLGGRARRGDPPPLPPKPKLLNMKPDSHAIQSGSFLPPDLGQTRTDERGYSVSFV